MLLLDWLVNCMPIIMRDETVAEGLCEFMGYLIA